jgi:hypothetical protein
MDILINPVLPADLGFTSWERHTEVLWQAYPGTAMWIEAQSHDATRICWP